MKLVIEIACGILLAKVILILLGNGNDEKAVLALLEFPFKMIALPFHFIAWLCRLIDSPRRKRNWRIRGWYYAVLALPPLSVYFVTIGMIESPGILGAVVVLINLACLAFAILLAISFIFAGNTKDKNQDSAHSKESSGDPNG